MATKYRVVAGDTLCASRPAFYRDPSLYEVIAIANSLPDPDLIRVGHLLLIQGLTREHKVVSGDTQGALAVRFYGDGMLFTLIAATYPTRTSAESDRCCESRMCEPLRHTVGGSGRRDVTVRV